VPQIDLWKPRVSESEGAAERLTIFGAFALWLIIVLAWGWTRSAWLDEFFTAGVTNPAKPFSDLYAAWQSDQHPPAYSLMLYLWRLLTHVPPNNIFALRVFGIILSACLVVGALNYWRASGWPGRSIFAVLMLSAPGVFFFPEETRSYFLSVFGGVYSALFFLRALEAEASPRFRDGIVGALGVGLCATHLMSLAFLCVFAIFMGVLLIRVRRWAWLRLGLAIGVIVLASVIAFSLAVMLKGVTHAVGSFWITRHELLATVVTLPLLLGAPIVGVVVAACVTWRAAAGEDGAPYLMIAAILASVAVLLAISVLKPMLVLRYLSAPAAALIPAASILIDRWASSRALPKWSAAAAALLCFALGLPAANEVRFKSDWLTPSRAVNMQTSCEGAVIPFLILNNDPGSPWLAGGGWTEGFFWYAPAHRFVPATPSNITEANGQACPVRLWIAEQYLRFIGVEYKAAVRKACDGDRRVALEFEGGYLVVDASAHDMISAWPRAAIQCSAIKVAPTGPF
jgi:hypothetical protein